MDRVHTRSQLKRFHRFIIVSAVILFTIAIKQSGAAASEWRLFRSESGGFSVSMPGQPMTKQTNTTSFIGTITNHIFVLWSKDRKFTVDYSDLPHLAVLFASTDTIYSHTRGSILKQTLSKQRHYENITIQGIKGKKLVYDIPPVSGRPKSEGYSYLLLDQDRLYVFDAQVPVADGGTSARRFLSSIRLTKH